LVFLSEIGVVENRAEGRIPLRWILVKWVVMGSTSRWN